jgi:hypothetical protein
LLTMVTELVFDNFTHGSEGGDILCQPVSEVLCFPQKLIVLLGTIISQNVIRDEDVDIAVNTPAEVDIHLNNLLGEAIGVADVCALDKSKACTGSIDATENYWGCSAGPGGGECSTVSGADIRFTPWLRNPIPSDEL